MAQTVHVVASPASGMIFAYSLVPVLGSVPFRQHDDELALPRLERAERRLDLLVRDWHVQAKQPGVRLNLPKRGGKADTADAAHTLTHAAGALPPHDFSCAGSEADSMMGGEAEPARSAQGCSHPQVEGSVAEVALDGSCRQAGRARERDVQLHHGLVVHE
eukprot:scaffold11066_cov146-Isochrysis_galbana.AAC.2